MGKGRQLVPVNYCYSADTRWSREFEGLCVVDLSKATVAIIGLGYVGLPLAVEFGKIRPTIGFDIDSQRIQELISGNDRTREVSTNGLLEAKHLDYSDEEDRLFESEVFIVTVPTPVDDSKSPDFSPLRAATSIVARHLRPGALVIYESTVYPGATESVCVPLLESESGLVFNRDFFVGYSPERINPGDQLHKLSSVAKVTSGSTPDAANAVDALYRSIIHAGTHLAPSIKVAEAAKVIENVQRDVNIALINELAVLFRKLNIDTQDVLAAAGSKWNFLHFTPGLVGGHCIGVDPYYLTHRAQEVGHHPEIILAGRRINDAMGKYVAERVVLLMVRAGININSSKILLLGLAFKENCPDIRNSKVADVYAALRNFGAEVYVYDPLVDSDLARTEYGINMTPSSELFEQRYSAVIHAVPHEIFANSIVPNFKDLLSDPHVVYDVKGTLPVELVDERL
jgi:UDP-N-acetyl-D-galactosamine dehydrogenase